MWPSSLVSIPIFPIHWTAISHISQHDEKRKGFLFSISIALKWMAVSKAYSFSPVGHKRERVSDISLFFSSLLMVHLCDLLYYVTLEKSSVDAQSSMPAKFFGGSLLTKKVINETFFPFDNGITASSTSLPSLFLASKGNSSSIGHCRRSWQKKERKKKPQELCQSFFCLPLSIRGKNLFHRRKS